MKDKYREANLREAVTLASDGAKVVVYCWNVKHLARDFDAALQLTIETSGVWESCGNLMLTCDDDGWLTFLLDGQSVDEYATHVVSVGQQGVQALMFTPTESDHPDGAE